MLFQMERGTKKEGATKGEGATDAFPRVSAPCRAPVCLRLSHHFLPRCGRCGLDVILDDMVDVSSPYHFFVFSA